MSDSILPGTLVSADWLAERLNEPNLRVVDIRGYVNTVDLGEGKQRAEYVGAREEFDQAHIPGAVYVDWTFDIIDPDDPVPAQIAPARRFAEAMGTLGIGNDTDVVAVDHAGGHFATRLWWALRYFGPDRVAVLDGGFNRWKALGLPLSSQAAPVELREFVAEEHPELRVTADDVLGLIDKPGSQIVDARDPDQYSGAVARGARGGHVPSAITVWAKSLFREDGTWKPDDELREVLRSGGIYSEGSVVAYCNGGVTATAILFALDRIGHTDWANYDGSWNEWGERLDLPVEESASLREG